MGDKHYLGHKIIHHETYSRQHKVKIQNYYTADVQMQGIWNILEIFCD
jgi:hypothetical protein